jgi:hypothetical protein
MKITWKELSFLPSEDALAALYESWSWLLPRHVRPVMASTLGDVFFQTEGPEVFWLNTGTAEIEKVAATREEFMELLKTEKADEWFMPHLIEQLLAAGKLLKPDQCYTYVTLPVFNEGKYEVANLNPVPAKEHFALTGHVHKEIKGLPEGAAVKLEIDP